MPKNQNLLFSPPDYHDWFKKSSQNIWEKLRGKKLLAAFSGGKDSLALLHYLYVHKSLMGWDVAACHVNHNLRGEQSIHDAGFCREWCFVHGILYDEVVVDVKGSLEVFSRGTEYAARIHRYRALEEARERTGRDYILTAHTLDDQIESFFVDLLTGASLYTIGGIEAMRGRLVRPILVCSSDNITEYNKRNSLSPVYDGSNDDQRYYRNLVRQKLAPVLKELGVGIIGSIKRLQDESVVLREWMDKRTADAVCNMAEGGVIISRKKLEGFSSVEQRYIIGKWLSFLCRGGRLHAEALIKQLYRQRSVRHNLPEGWLCEVTPRVIRIFPASSVTPFYAEKAQGTRNVDLPDGRKALFPPSMADSAYRLRSRKKGDRFLGKKLKDLFERREVDPYLRDRAVIVEDSDGIIWVEHIGDPSENAVEVSYKTT